MIDFLRGVLVEKKQNIAIIDVGGVGYSINITSSTSNKLSINDNEVKLYIVESTGMYGGVVSCYGFLSKDEREMFSLIKDEVPATGAKKAMEYMEKISSFSDFKTAIVARDSGVLTSAFGFTKKTAEKLISALKDKISTVTVNDNSKWVGISSNTNVVEAIAGLVSLGYKEMQARTIVNEIVKNNSNLSVEDIIKDALKHL